MNQRKLDDLDFYEKYLLNAGQACCNTCIAPLARTAG